MKKIVADSGCDLRTLQFDDENISYEQVAFKINVGNRVYVDYADLDIDALVSDLRQSRDKSGDERAVQLLLIYHRTDGRL